MGERRSAGEAARSFEFVLVGGGLQSGLVALAVLAQRPNARLAVVEAGLALGGNHTWSISPGDLPAAARPWFEPLVVHRWSDYDVVFPKLRRTLGVPYCTVTSDRFAAVVRDAVARSAASACYLGRRAVRLDEHEVVLDGGAVLRAEMVIDARGPDPEARAGCGFQKFLGLEVELDRPHTCRRPVVMDATVPQRDGFRFFYVLPFGPRRLLVEDTCFSRSPSLDHQAARAAVLEYASRHGRVTRVLREETGVLPMPWASGARAPGRSPLVAGYRGGWFHPATGYSLPWPRASPASSRADRRGRSSAPSSPASIDRTARRRDTRNGSTACCFTASHRRTCATSSSGSTRCRRTSSIASSRAR